MKTTIFLIALIYSSLAASGQDTALRVMFYNVENMFDTIDTPDKEDSEYLPTSKLNHGTVNYNLKKEHIARVINSAFGKVSVPDFLGLCEVENRAVVEDLVKELNKSKVFKVVHTESKDGRGIDNALVFNSKKVKLLEFGTQEIVLSDERPTRDILWAHFAIKKGGRNVTVFVNHWPSRSGGAEKSEPKRLAASSTLSNLIYELRQRFPNSDEIVMGDFNDYPDNKSLEMLESCIFPESPCLKNTHRYLQGTEVGSHAYQGEWGMLDQILVSKGLYNKREELFIEENTGQIISYDWMLYKSNYDDQLYPARFYGRDKCFGGYSDHLPVSLSILRK